MVALSTSTEEVVVVVAVVAIAWVDGPEKEVVVEGSSPQGMALVVAGGGEEEDGVGKRGPAAGLGVFGFLVVDNAGGDQSVETSRKSSS